MIKGNLSSFSLGEIFQSLAVNNHTGTLKIQEKDGTEKYVYFSKGEICLFSSRTQRSLRIGEILVRLGKLSREDLDRALRFQKETSERLGKILIKRCGLGPEDIQHALEVKIYEEINDLFLLSEAEFEFFVDHFPEEVFEAIPENVRISINATSVIMEGLRVAEEWKVIQKQIRTFNEIFAFVSEQSIDSFDDPLEQSLAEHLDGRLPIHKIFDLFPGSRFDCCKTVFGFLGAGIIRPLTVEECRERGAQAGKSGDLEMALDFLRFAVELSPDRPEPLVLVGKVLTEMGRDQEGTQALLEGCHLFYQDGNYQEVLRVGEGLVKQYPHDDILVETVFQSAVHCEKLSQIETYGSHLADLLVTKGLKTKAIEVYTVLCEFFPKLVDYKIRLAEMFKETGSLKKATAALEDAAESLSGKGQISQRIKVLRSIYELSPDRQDVKQEISNLLETQERWENRKKKRFTIAGIALISFLALLVIPFLYEVKARELYSHAQRLEAISKTSGNYTVARSTYEEIVDAYGFSTRASSARDALNRIGIIERDAKLKVENEKQSIERNHTEKLHGMRMALTTMVDTARNLEEKGDYEGAFNILKKISTDFPEIPKTKLILLPLKISSVPEQCEVEVNGEKVGRTPVVIRKKKGELLSISLARVGCETSHREITVGDTWRVHFDMNLRPIATFRTSGPIHQPIEVRDGALFFPSRDGFFYSVHPKDRSVNWKRKIGSYGDLTSIPSYTPVEIVLSNVRGELAAISRKTGKSRWRTQIGAAAMARPAVSPDGSWVAVGDLTGKVTIVNNLTGEIRGQYRAENEIRFAPRFWNGHLIVPGEDNALHILTVPEARPVHLEFFANDIDSELAFEKNRVHFTTRDGALHSYDLKLRTMVWTYAPKARVTSGPTRVANTMVIGTEDGKIHAVDVSTGDLSWELEASSSALGDFRSWKGFLYFGTDDGEILGVNTNTRQVAWRYRFEDSVIEAPAVVGQRLFFASANGTFVVMETFQ